MTTPSHNDLNWNSKNRINGSLYQVFEVYGLSKTFRKQDRDWGQTSKIHGEK